MSAIPLFPDMFVHLAVLLLLFLVSHLSIALWAPHMYETDSAHYKYIYYYHNAPGRCMLKKVELVAMGVAGEAIF